jgi:hypothetical protein
VISIYFDSLSSITPNSGTTEYLARTLDSSDWGTTWNLAFKSELFFIRILLVSG